MGRRRRQLLATLFLSAKELTGIELHWITGLWSGTLYVALYDLEERGYVRSLRLPSGARRYSLTDQGRDLATSEFTARAVA